ncbi:hypothetical protein BKN14_04220 [Candidatus Gracilibacteria bacterium HOT-871]|nr:hypothetical protein BKN14_04220 [Candidatus Gracilibacteria bacterium HOT-871]MBB1564556.1 transcriptional regulator [Candidatus Gracilibacteria bacterium]MBF0913818.1 transcriptional regulator [Candidatus Gracilibacteria bacterium]
MLEPLFIDVVRFQIVVNLFREKNDFTTLKEKLGISDGNLSFHLKKLEKAEIIHTEKAFSGKKVKTFVELTDSGRKKLFEHLYELENITKDIK